MSATASDPPSVCASLARPITPFMAGTLARLAESPLSAFRVGYAPTAKGPFTPRGTIESLLARRLAFRAVCRGERRVFIAREGRAALEAWRAANPLPPAPELDP